MLCLGFGGREGSALFFPPLSSFRRKYLEHVLWLSRWVAVGATRSLFSLPLW